MAQDILRSPLLFLLRLQHNWQLYRLSREQQNVSVFTASKKMTFSVKFLQSEFSPALSLPPYSKPAEKLSNFTLVLVKSISVSSH